MIRRRWKQLLWLILVLQQPPVVNSQIVAPQGLRYEIHLRSDDGTVIAEYRLNHAVQEFSFDTVARTIRSKTMRLVSGDVALRESTVRPVGTRQFDRFSVRILPDAEEVDRVYPVVQRIGREGLLIYMPHLLGTSDAQVSRVVVNRMSSQVVVWGAMQDSHANGGQVSVPSDRYVFVGPQRYVDARHYSTVISAPDTPAWLTSLASRSLERQVQNYSQALGMSLPGKPLLILSHDPKLPPRWRGDTTPGFTVALRFHGDEWVEPTAKSQALLTRSIAHEAFHFWNGEMAQSNDSESQPWLHEGSAEYAAIVTGNPEEGPVEANVQAALNECSAVLQAQALAGGIGRRGRAPYACGVVISWIADIASTSRDRGMGFFAIWQELLKTRPQYSASDFLQIARRHQKSADLDKLLSVILEREGVSRWFALSEQLQKLGIQVQTSTTDESLRSQLLQHLLKQNCESSQRLGFFTRNALVELDNEPVCKALPAKHLVKSVEGHDLFDDPEGAFDAVVSRCAKHEYIVLSGPQTSLRATCNENLPRPSPVFSIGARKVKEPG